MMDKMTIWSNIDLDIDDWRDDILAEHPDYSEDEVYNMMNELNDIYLDDERTNLDIQLSQPILVIADFGLWNGRCNGYKDIASGNIKDCLRTSTDYATWFVDNLGDLRCEAVHHDGTNRYLYREWKESATETQRDNLRDKIYSGTATRHDITRLTRRLGDHIANVYGWEGFRKC